MADTTQATPTYKPIPEHIKAKMVAVLKEYVKIGVIGRAFDNAGVPRKTHNLWLATYPTYKERFEEFRERFTDGLEVVAIERAKEKSDALMMMMLKAHRPEVYSDKTEVKHTSGAGIQLIFADGMLTETEKKLIKGGNNEETTD